MVVHQKPGFNIRLLCAEMFFFSIMGYFTSSSPPVHVLFLTWRMKEAEEPDWTGFPLLSTPPLCQRTKNANLCQITSLTHEDTLKVFNPSDHHTDFLLLDDSRVRMFRSGVTW